MLLHINTRYRFPGDTISNFSVQLDPSTTLNNPTKLTLVNAVIPQSWYNFDSTNNVITFAEGGGNLTATITPGNYSSSTLKTEMETRLNAAGALTYTVTFDSTTGLTTIAATGSFSLKFTALNSPYYRLGFTATDTNSSGSHTSTYGFNLAPDSFVYLSIQGLKNCYSSTTQPAYFTFPLALSGNGYSVASDSTGYSIALTNNIFSTKTLRIQLLNEQGMFIGALCDFGFTIALS
jgi:hypothetical protein